jgi:hypothetical protein
MKRIVFLTLVLSVIVNIFQLYILFSKKTCSTPELYYRENTAKTSKNDGVPSKTIKYIGIPMYKDKANEIPLLSFFRYRQMNYVNSDVEGKSGFYFFPDIYRIIIWKDGTVIWAPNTDIKLMDDMNIEPLNLYIGKISQEKIQKFLDYVKENQQKFVQYNNYNDNFDYVRFIFYNDVFISFGIEPLSFQYGENDYKDYDSKFIDEFSIFWRDVREKIRGLIPESGYPFSRENLYWEWCTFDYFRESKYLCPHVFPSIKDTVSNTKTDEE